jgi:hypothetical protein
MADLDRLSGKQSYFMLGGVKVPITKVDPTVTRKLGDTTDSGDYNTTQDMLPTTQIPCTYTLEASVEGRFRKSVTPTSFLEIAFTSGTQIPIVIGLDASPTIWGHGACDIANFKTSIPVDDIITFSCDIKSWGTFTPNS